MTSISVSPPHSSVGLPPAPPPHSSLSTHTALSPFQSQYYVFITADCSRGGEHINTGTCSYYVTLLSLLHTPFRSLSFVLFLSLFLHQLFVCLLFSLCCVWIYFYSQSSLSIFAFPAASNEYLIYSLSLLSDGLRE